MPQPHIARPPERAPAREGPRTAVLQPALRFLLHFLEMCAVMCLGGVLLSVLFFEAAVLLGYDNLPQRAPELSVLVVALNLSLPMALWMRYRGMDWRPTLEMAGSTMALGFLAVAAYWLGLVAADDVIGIVTRLACPVMLAVMLLRFRLYCSKHGSNGTSGPEQPA